MAKTKERVSGVLNFQEDFNIKPIIECYKSCKNCQREESFVYVILSDKPITKNLMQTKGLNIDRDNKPIGMRAFRHRTNSSFEPIIARVRFTIL